MGFFSSLFGPRPKAAIKAEEGLSYRVVNNFKIEVLIAPKWREFDGEPDDTDFGKPDREDLETIKRLNAVSDCKNKTEAYAVATVLFCMEHFCENCGEEVYPDDKKCQECKKPLWKGKKKLEMVVVHVTP